MNKQKYNNNYRFNAITYELKPLFKVNLNAGVITTFCKAIFIIHWL